MTSVYLERGDLPHELQVLLETGVSPECTPPLDIVETARGVEIVMDLPGIAASAVDIVFARNVVLIAGRKDPRASEDGDAAFHIAERAFGRFARAISLDGAFDLARAGATLAAGELRVVLPTQEDRRGRQIRIPVRSE
jgi:HSP20 family protein